MADHTQEACDGYIKAYKNVGKLYKMMGREEIDKIFGEGKSLMDEYIRI